MGLSKRHAHYSEYVCTGVCERIAAGMTLNDALREDPKAPDRRTWMIWLIDHPEIKQMYEQAREMAADAHADKLLMLAEKAENKPKDAPGIKVAADILKWQAEVKNPDRYGKRLDISNRKPPTDPDKIRAEIARLEKELGIQTIGMSDGKAVSLPAEHEHVFAESPPERPPEG